MSEVLSQNPDELKPPLKEEKEQNSVPQEQVEQILQMTPKQLADFLCAKSEDELRGFLEMAFENKALVAQISYWEKWLEKDQRRLVDEAVAKKMEIYGEQSDSLPLCLDEKFSQDDLDLIFSNMGAIQLTFGCSNGCPFCGLDALPGAREHIPYSRLANMFKRYGKQVGKGKPVLYWASEPSNYASKVGLEDKTYQDVHQLAVEYAGYNPYVTSKETRDDQWLDFLNVVATKGSGGPGSQPNARVSVYGLEDGKVEQLREKAPEVRLTGEEGAKHTESYGVHFEEGQPVPGLESEPVIDKFRGGICHLVGFVLTPRGLYQVADVPLSHDFPQGIIVSPFEKRVDRKIKNGDNLRDILRYVVATDDHGIEYSSPRLFFEAEYNPVYNLYLTPLGKFRKFLEITTKDGKKYQVWHDEKGVVQRVEEANGDLIATEEKIEKWRLKKNREARRKQREEYDVAEARREELRLEYVKEYKEFPLKVNDFIQKAIAENKVVIEDKQLSLESITAILEFCQKTNFHTEIKELGTDSHFFSTYGEDKKRDVITESFTLSDYGFDFDEIAKDFEKLQKRGVHLAIDYFLDTGDVMIVVRTGRSADEKYYQESVRDATEKSKKTNQLFAEAIKNNRVKIYTNWSEEQVRKIIKTLLDTDLSSFKEPHKGWTDREPTIEMEIEGVGRVVAEVVLEEEDKPTLYIL